MFVVERVTFRREIEINSNVSGRDARKTLFILFQNNFSFSIGFEFSSDDLVHQNSCST